MVDNFNLTTRITAAVGATLVLVGTFLPWYSYEAVLPTPGGLRVLPLSATLWAVTTLAPILIVAASVVVLALVAVAPERIAGAGTAVLGVGVLAYAIVRCFDIPRLGVVLLAPAAAAKVATVTNVEGGAFVTIGGAAMILLGGMGALLPSRTVAPVGEPARPADRTSAQSTPHAAT